MDRRNFIAGMGATALAPTLSAPSLAQSAKASTMTFVPVSALVSLDSSVNTSTTTVTHGYYVFDTLYSIDSKYRAMPQMAEGHTISDDKLTWNIKLRPGLKFHDGTPVLARDCVASIKRWGQRDAFGVSLLAYSDEVSAADDSTIRFRLKKPFGVLADSLAHPHASPLHIMPERLATPDVSKPVTEMVGSGPYKFIASEFVPGQRSVYEKNTAYVPRQEKPDCLSGGKVVNFDRVEWRTMADSATAAASLQSGEIDWWEVAQGDLVELLSRNKDVMVATFDPLGYTSYLRFNCGTPPFNNAAIRRVAASALNQTDYNTAIVGPSPDKQRTCYALYSCGLPGVEELGKPLMDGKKDYAAIGEALKKAGYNGEKVVIMSAVDVGPVAPLGPITADALKKIGMNVDLQSIDWNTLVGRRSSNEPTEKGGWSIFQSLSVASTLANPLVNLLARGLGTKGFAGNYDDPQLEAMIADWVAASTDKERDEKLDKVHRRLWEAAPIIPLGNYFPQTAFRKNITGHLPGPVAVPWNMKRA